MPSPTLRADICSMPARPAIAADVKRQVLVEAGHRCAIPTCREIVIEVHHIEPWSKSQDHSYGNLIALCPTCHARADRGEIDRKSLRLYKANLRYTHERFSQFEVDVLLGLAKLGVNNASQDYCLPPYNMLLVKRLLDASYIKRFRAGGGSGAIGGINVTPEYLVLTKAGNDFVESLGVSDLDRDRN